MTVDISKLKDIKVQDRKEDEIIERLEDIKMKINEERIISLQKLNQKDKDKKLK